MKKTIVAAVAVITSVSVALIGYLAVGAASGGQESRAASNSGAASSQTVSHKTVVMSPDFDVVYTGIPQLAKAAHLIVQGTASDVSYFNSNGVTYTKVILAVSKVFKGNVTPESKVVFIEIGGVTTEAAMIREDDSANAASITPEQEATKVDVLFGGAPLTEEGGNVIYFGIEGDISFDKFASVEGVYYQPVGAFQGKFDVTNGIAERYRSPTLAGSAYRALRTGQGTIGSQVRNAIGATS